MQITDFIIHRIEKRQHEAPSVHTRDTVLKVADPRVVKFAEETIAFFSNRKDRPNTVFAPFHDDTDNFPMSKHCNGYFDGSVSFLDLSQKAAHRLHHCMSSRPLATGGYLVVASYREEAIRNLLIVMLHKQDGFSVDDSTLDLLDVTHLDLKDIDKAALVNGGIEGSPAPDKPLTYAGFRKTLSQYFQEFLGPDRFRDPKKDSHELIQVVDDYCNQNGFDQAKRDTIRTDLRKYVNTQTDTGEELELSSISAIVNAVEPTAFSAFATDRKISAAFRPDPTVFKRWKVIRHRSKDGVTVQFPAEALNHRVFLDADKKTLTIKEIEPEFIALVGKATAIVE